jgi:hypothetical protein
MSSSLLWRCQVAVLPADRVGLHRIGSAFTCVPWIKTAFDASRCPVLETGTSCGSAGPPYATGIWDNEATLPRGDRICVWWIGQRCLSLGQAKAPPNPRRRDADDRAAIAVVRRPGITALWSILLTLGDLTLPSTIIAGGTLAGIRHWLSWSGDATLLLRDQRRSLVALDVCCRDLLGASSEGGSRRALRTRSTRFLHARSISRR